MNLRNIFTSAMLAAATLAFTGCTEDIDSPDFPEGDGDGNVTITLRCAKPGSRATDDTNNENLIKEIWVYLYKADSDDDTSKPVAEFQRAGLNGSTVQVVNVNLTKEQTNELFPNGEGDQCRLVAVANPYATMTRPVSPTVNELRAITAGSSFRRQDGKTSQTSFLMYGDTNEGRPGTVELTYHEGDFGGKAEGNVVMVRAAARINLNIKLPATIRVVDKIEGTDTTWAIWESLPGSMKVMLDQGVAQSIIDPSATEEKPRDGDYFSLTENSEFLFNKSEAVADTAYPYKQIMPFYTYPNSWESSPQETHKTAMTLIVPWRKEGTQSFRTCYYKVPVTGGTQLLRNTAYTVNLKVGMLGSFIKEEPLVVEPSFFAVDWAEVATNVDIKNYRYLVVNQNSFVIDNQPSIEIPFYSSHPVEISEITMTYERFNVIAGTGANSGQVAHIPITAAQNKLSGVNNNNDSIFSYSIEDMGQSNYKLIINHPLRSWQAVNASGTAIRETGYNDTTTAINALKAAEYYIPTSETPYSPYVFRITIKHKDQNTGSAFEETMTVTQYPGMWILPDRNPGNTNMTGTATGFGGNWPNNASERGYVYINASTDYYSSQSQTSIRYVLGGTNGLTGGNKNPNMYVITINTLDSDLKNYIVDDPRYYAVINLNNTRTGNNNSNYYLTGTTNLNDRISDPKPGSAAATALSNSPNEQNGNNNNRWYWTASGNALYRGTELTSATNSRLTYYYPTNESPDFEYVIAPKLRIASSFGVTYDLNRNNARRRCASYQEAGRPAGRWRLPTFGELEYIVTLSRQNKIPTLFSAGGEYWTAQGYVSIPSDRSTALEWVESNSDEAAVRCVYDEWFWKDFLPASNNSFSSYYGTFTWGDRPKANPEATN